MFKRLRWLIIGYVLGVTTFDMLKRYLDQRYSDNKAYITVISTLDSVTDFNNNRKSAEVFIDEN